MTINCGSRTSNIERPTSNAEGKGPNKPFDFGRSMFDVHGSNACEKTER